MRLILTLALATGLAALCQVQVGAAAVGQPQAQGATQTECGTASPGDSSRNPAGQSINATCPPKSLDRRLSQHGPGFWTPEAVALALDDVAGGSRPTVLRAPPSQASADAPGCISHPLMVVISGEPREATVVGCPRPNGGWQVTQYTPGLPTQVYNVPAPPTTGLSQNDFGGWNSAPVWDWAAQPWFFGFAPAIVVGPGSTASIALAMSLRMGSVTASRMALPWPTASPAYTTSPSDRSPVSPPGPALSRSVVDPYNQKLLNAILYFYAGATSLRARPGWSRCRCR